MQRGLCILMHPPGPFRRGASLHISPTLSEEIGETQGGGEIESAPSKPANNVILLQACK